MTNYVSRCKLSGCSNVFERVTRAPVTDANATLMKPAHKAANGTFLLRCRTMLSAIILAVISDRVTINVMCYRQNTQLFLEIASLTVHE